jgi:hypothetical protein
MRRREEAGSLDLAGWPMSRYDGRVSAPGTKPNRSFGSGFLSTTKATRSWDGTVRHALMRGQRFANLNDEILRRPGFHQVHPRYKDYPKGEAYASAAGTASLWPRSQGCQQSYSTVGLGPGSKGSTTDRSGVLRRITGSPRDKLVIKPTAREVRWLRTVSSLSSHRTASSRRRHPCSGLLVSPFFGARSVLPSRRNTVRFARCWDRPVRETRPPVNMGN